MIRRAQLEHSLGLYSRLGNRFGARLFREFGDRYLQSMTLTHIGDIHHDAGELAQARQAWEQALAIFDDIKHPEAEQVRAKLAGTRD
jgi:predicted negative regulator of RcsB-dependent stress response